MTTQTLNLFAMNVIIGYIGKWKKKKWRMLKNEKDIYEFYL